MWSNHTNNKLRKLLVIDLFNDGLNICSYMLGLNLLFLSCTCASRRTSLRGDTLTVFELPVLTSHSSCPIIVEWSDIPLSDWRLIFAYNDLLSGSWRFLSPLNAFTIKVFFLVYLYRDDLIKPDQMSVRTSVRQQFFFPILMKLSMWVEVDECCTTI